MTGYFVQKLAVHLLDLIGLFAVFAGHSVIGFLVDGLSWLKASLCFADRQLNTKKNSTRNLVLQGRKHLPPHVSPLSQMSCLASGL